MTDMAQAYEALRKADAAGDTAGAKRIADYIRSQPGGGVAPTEGVQPVALTGEDIPQAIAQGSKSWFSANEPEAVSMGEVGGAMAGGAAGGALAGAVVPGALQAAGKVIPGPVGKLFTGLGEASKALPLKERMIRGAGGGAAAGAVEEAGRAFGAPKALTFAGEALAGGLGESTASLVTSTAAKLTHFASNLAIGRPGAAVRAAGDVFKPNGEVNMAVARKLQQKLFGDKTEAYVEGLVGSENRIAVQEALRKADPSLVPQAAKPDGVRAPWESSTGEMGSMGRQSMSRDVAAAGGQGWGPKAIEDQRAARLGKGTFPSTVRSQESLDSDKAAAMAAGKAGAHAKAATAAEAKRKAEEEAAAAALRPASEIYRERMFGGVTQAVREGKAFSSTPEFAGFMDKLDTMQKLGKISNADRVELQRVLTADRMKKPAVQEGYAQAVDEQIRGWGKPLEKGGATGAAAVSEQTAREVRGALQEAYNKYTGRLGLGDIEAKYRNAYSQEMIAQAKDELPHFLYGFGSAQQFQKLARNLARDPQGLPFIQQKMAQHLAQQEPKAIVGEFERLQKVLVDSKLATPTDLRALRQNAETVQTAVNRGEGSVVKLGQRFQQILLMTMARNAAAQGGAAAGRPKAGEEGGAP